MALIKTHGFVLRRRDLGEADRLLTLFTQRFGKVKAVARGLRKAKSRLAGHLEPFHISTLHLWRREGRDLALVRGADLVETYPFLSTDLGAFAVVSFAGELLDRSLEEDEPHPRLFALTVHLLRELRTPGRAPAALLGWTIQAAADLGYRVALVRCAECGGPLPAAAAWLWFDYPRGGLICPRCAPVASSRSGERLGRELITALREPHAAAAGPATAAVRALDRLLGWHQDRRPLNAERQLGTLAASS